MKLPRLITIAIAALSVASQDAARAEQAMCAQDASHSSLRDDLLALPADTDMAIAVRGLSRLRATGVGPLVRGALADPVFDEVRERWGALSEAIGMEPVVAFDAVLGERVLLAVRTPEGAPPDWVLVSEVSSRTELTLRRQLKVSPRTIVAGQTLYTVERGALELSFARASSAQRAGTARLLLAPAGSSLFEQTVRGPRPADALGAHPDLAPLLAADIPADLLMVARTPDRENAWLGVAGRVEEGRVSLSLRAMRSVAKPEAQPAPAQRGWRESLAAGIAKDALFAVFDTEGSTLSSAATLLEPLAMRTLFMPDPERAEGVLAGREVAMLLPTESGMAMLAAVELLDTERGAAMGDESMDALLRSFGVSERGFGGILPEAVRRVEEGGASIAWVFRSAPARHGAPAPGWWLITTDPSLLPDASSSLLDSIAGAQPDARSGQSAPRALAFARPDKLVDALERLAVPLPPAMLSMRGVKEVRWREIDSDGPMTHAEVVVLLAGPPGPSSEAPDARPSSLRAPR